MGVLAAQGRSLQKARRPGILSLFDYREGAFGDPPGALFCMWRKKFCSSRGKARRGPCAEGDGAVAPKCPLGYRPLRGLCAELRFPVFRGNEKPSISDRPPRRLPHEGFSSSVLHEKGRRLRRRPWAAVGLFDRACLCGPYAHEGIRVVFIGAHSQIRDEGVDIALAGEEIAVVVAIVGAVEREHLARA